MIAIASPWPERVVIVRGAAEPAWFTDHELATARAFRLRKRADEWLLARAAAKQLALQLGLADDAQRVTVERPFLCIDGAPTEWQVSLSHSAPYAGAMAGREPVGVDVQVVREIAEWSSHLFLTEAETAEMQGCAVPHRVLHFWCAKEAAWKQRSGEYATMKQAPLHLMDERADGLRFDCVETRAIGDLIVAVTC